MQATLIAPKNGHKAMNETVSMGQLGVIYFKQIACHISDILILGSYGGSVALGSVFDYIFGGRLHFLLIFLSCGALESDGGLHDLPIRFGGCVGYFYNGRWFRLIRYQFKGVDSRFHNNFLDRTVLPADAE
jgi:hypothetical protein